MEREDRVILRAYSVFHEVVRLSGSLVLLQPLAPASAVFNRVVGLGTLRPATEDDLDEALAVLPQGTRYYVAVAPEAQPAELPLWLRARGLEPGWGWMRFRRDPLPVPEVRTTLHLQPVEEDAAAVRFARLVRVCYDLPEAIDPVVARAWRRGWECWLALEGGEPVAAAALYAAQGIAYLGFAATLSEHRGKGAQGALLARRILRAGQLGCDRVVTETGERRPDLPSDSYRNILRAGFQEIAVTANWRGRRPD